MARSRISPAGSAAMRVEHRQLDIFERGGAGEEVEALEDEADLAVADGGECVGVEGGDVDAVEAGRAAGRAVEAAEHVHQGGLAGAAGAHDGDELARHRRAATMPRTAWTGAAPVW